MTYFLFIGAYNGRVRKSFKNIQLKLSSEAEISSKPSSPVVYPQKWKDLLHWAQRRSMVYVFIGWK